jgi:hypothetical protein
MDLGLGAADRATTPAEERLNVGAAPQTQVCEAQVRHLINPYLAYNEIFALLEPLLAQRLRYQSWLADYTKSRFVRAELIESSSEL